MRLPPLSIYSFTRGNMNHFIEYYTKSKSAISFKALKTTDERESRL